MTLGISLSEYGRTSELPTRFANVVIFKCNTISDIVIMIDAIVCVYVSWVDIQSAQEIIKYVYTII